ncbi:MAG: hypothetical protein JSU84_06975 [Thiotrichales bacterium]|nr:MAG: hypothetical protein JSU84_06975 [Thiotrichales bacterium]
MSAVTSLTVNPNDADAIKNRITIIEPKFSNLVDVGGGVSFFINSISPSVYLHLFWGTRVRDTFDPGSPYIADNRQPSAGVFKPKILRKGFQYIDVVINGESVRADSVPRINPITLDSGIAEYQGVVNGSDSKYVVFNGQSAATMPAEAQAGNIVTRLVDSDGNELTAEANFSSGEIKSFSVNNGELFEVPAFGYVKVNFTYQAYRFKLSYECPDLIGVSRNISQSAIALYQSSYNEKTLENGFFMVQASIDGVPLVELYELKKDVEFFEFTTDVAQFSSELEETTRQEEERTYEDENGLSSIKMRVVKNVTLKGQDGKEWQLKFTEPPA